MEDNKKTYIIAGSILLLAYVIQRKRTYPTETNIFNLLFGGILYPMVPPPPPPPTPPPPPPPTPTEPITEQQEALIRPMPISKPVVAQIKPIVANAPKSYAPDTRVAAMPSVQPMRPAFGQYGKKV
jgi:hypothetical protein